jgi:hypothetical protein
MADYSCWEQDAPVIDQRRREIAAKTVERLLKDHRFRRLEEAYGPIRVHWFTEKSASDYAADRIAGFEFFETVKGAWEPDLSGGRMIGFFKRDDGSLIHLRDDIRYEDVARTVCHELAHADSDHSYRSGSLSESKGHPGDAGYERADESEAVREEIYLNRYHQGVR